jgi:hypothetical protein
MMELSNQQKMLSREQQVEMQQEMMKLMKDAVQMQKAGQAKAAAAEPRSTGSAAREELDLRKSWHLPAFHVYRESGRFGRDRSGRRDFGRSGNRRRWPYYYGSNENV